jgi:hypothetical protein
VVGAALKAVQLAAGASVASRSALARQATGGAAQLNTRTAALTAMGALRGLLRSAMARCVLMVVHDFSTEPADCLISINASQRA